MTTADNSAVPDFAGMLRLDTRGYVVVGAGVGIGRQTSHALAQVGSKVLCVDVDEGRAKEIAAEVGGVPLVADARERSEADRIIATAQAELGRLDGIVDIVGMARWASLLETPEEDWDWTFGMVLRHAYHLIQAAGKVMAGTGGTMVFVASIDGTISAPFHAPYGAAKGALLNLVRTASVELGPLGIRVNAVCPGPTATPRILAAHGGKIPASPAEGGSLYIPLGAVNETWDIASAILFLSTGLSRHISGQAITVDGAATNLVYEAETVTRPLAEARSEAGR
jgi:NAD(P)-dependent dehydrogenase (short-subunit alcohol dehydrogenase family)